MTSGPWYIGRDGKELGPYRYDSVRVVASNGKLRPDDLLWTEGMADWARADAVADFASFLPQRAPPAATPMEASMPRSASAHAQSSPQPESAPAGGNFILKHWRGQYSLGRSYWVNSVLAGMLLYALAAAISAADLTKNFGIHTAGFWALGVLSIWTLISIWSVVGVWRSADVQVSRGGQSGWATAAKVLMALGMLRLVVSVVQSAPIMHQSLSLAFGHDTMPASQLRVLNRATEVEIGGGVSFGTANSLKTILDATPTVRLVQLNNVGGWINEGVLLSELVAQRKLATYTARECDSACLLVFLAGEHRYLGTHGKLGFHEASLAGTGGEEAKNGTQVFRTALQARGVPEDFINKALSTPAASLWYPTKQELLDAHVITDIVDEQQFGQTGIEGWQDRVRLEQEFADVPLFAAVAKAEPKTYERLKRNYVSGVQSGLPQSEITAQVRSAIIDGILPKYLFTRRRSSTYCLLAIPGRGNARVAHTRRKQLRGINVSGKRGCEPSVEVSLGESAQHRRGTSDCAIERPSRPN